jgi:two-component system sensor histidine kinase/response regulator
MGNRDGARPGKSLGLKDPELFPAEAEKQHTESDLFVMQSGKTMTTEETIRNTAGGDTVFLTTKVPMVHEGNIIGLCGISTDITQRKHMEEELVAAKGVAEDAAKSKADFLANMSHEIRTPMNAIMGMTFLLKNTDLSNKQKEYVLKIHRSSQHLLGVINDILDFSKIEAGRMEIETTDFKLHSVLENLFNLIGEKCSAKNLELIFDVDPISRTICAGIRSGSGRSWSTTPITPLSSPRRAR